MSRPPKSAAQIKAEGKSHRTKAEMAAREKGEAALKSEKPIAERAEVKSDPIAHKEFLRVKADLKKIQKDDALYTSVINRYCVLYSECCELEEQKKETSLMIKELREDFKELKFKTNKAKADAMIKFINSVEKLTRQLLSYDSALMSKRKMMLDIEKENCMTVSSALRAIPKTPTEEKNALLEALTGDDEQAAEGQNESK